MFVPIPYEYGTPVGIDNWLAGEEMSQNNNGLMFSTGMVPQMGVQWDRRRMCVAVIIAIAGPRLF